MGKMVTRKIVLNHLQIEWADGVNLHSKLLISYHDSGNITHLIFWTTSYGHSKRGRKCTTYPDSIVKDLDLEPNEIQQLMKNKTT